MFRAPALPSLTDSVRPFMDRPDEDLRLTRLKNLIEQAASVHLLKEGAPVADMKMRLPPFAACEINDRELMRIITESEFQLTSDVLALDKIPEGELRHFIMTSANTLIAHFHHYFKETNLFQKTLSNELNLRIRHVMKNLVRLGKNLNENDLKDYVEKYYDYLHQFRLKEIEVTIFLHALNGPQSKNATYNTSVSILTNALKHYAQGENRYASDAVQKKSTAQKRVLKGIRARFHELKEDVIIGVLGDIYHSLPQTINDNQLQAIVDFYFQVDALSQQFTVAAEAYAKVPTEKRHLVESMGLTPKAGYEILNDTIRDIEPLKKQIINEVVPYAGAITAAQDHVASVGEMIGTGVGLVANGVMNIAKWFNIVSLPHMPEFFENNHKITNINEQKFRDAVAFYTFLKTLALDITVSDPASDNEAREEALFKCFFNKTDSAITYQEYVRLEPLLAADENTVFDNLQQFNPVVVLKALRHMAAFEISLTHSSDENVFATLAIVNEDRVLLSPSVAYNNPEKEFFKNTYGVKLGRLLIAAQQKIIFPAIYAFVEQRNVDKTSSQYTLFHQLALELQAGRLISYENVQAVEKFSGKEFGFKPWINEFYTEPNQQYTQAQLMSTVPGGPEQTAVAVLTAGLDFIKPKTLLEIVIAHLEKQDFSIENIQCDDVIKAALKRKQAYCQKLALLLKTVKEKRVEKGNKKIAKALYALPNDALEALAVPSTKQAFDFLKRLVAELGPMTLLSPEANKLGDLAQRLAVFLIHTIENQHEEEKQDEKGKQDVAELMQDFAALYQYQQDMSKKHTQLDLSMVWIEAELSDPFNMSTHGALVVHQIVRSYVDDFVKELKDGTGWTDIKNRISLLPGASMVTAYVKPAQKEVSKKMGVKATITDQICAILGFHVPNDPNAVTRPEMLVGEFFRHQALTGGFIADEKTEHNLFYQTIGHIQAWVNKNKIRFNINAQDRDAFIKAVFSVASDEKQISLECRYLLLKFHFDYLKRYADIYANSQLKSEIYSYLRGGLTQLLEGSDYPLTDKQRNAFALLDADCNTVEKNHQIALEREMTEVQEDLVRACQKIDGQLKQVEVADESGNVPPTRSRYEKFKKIAFIGAYIADAGWTAANLYFVIQPIVQFVTALVHAVQITGAVIAGAAYAAFLSSPIGWALLGLHLVVNIGMQIYRCETDLDKNGQPKKLFTKLFSSLTAETTLGKVGEVFKKAATFAKLVFWDVLGKAILSTLFTSFIVNKVVALIRPAQMAVVQAAVAAISDNTEEKQAELSRLRGVVNQLNESGLLNEERKQKMGALKAIIKGIKRDNPSKHCDVSEFTALIEKFDALQNAHDALNDEPAAPIHDSAGIERQLRRPRKAVIAEFESPAPQTQSEPLLTWDDVLRGIKEKRCVVFDTNIVAETPLTGSEFTASELAEKVNSFVKPGESAPVSLLFNAPQDERTLVPAVSSSPQPNVPQPPV